MKYTNDGKGAKPPATGGDTNPQPLKGAMVFKSAKSDLMKGTTNKGRTNGGKGY